MLDSEDFFGDPTKLRYGVWTELQIGELCCPICGYVCVHRGEIFPINYSNDSKTDGIAIEFNCEAGHIFYIVMEDYKGYSYMTYTDKNFRAIKPVALEEPKAVLKKPQNEMTVELVKAFQSMNFVDKMEIMNAVLEKSKMKGNQ